MLGLHIVRGDNICVIGEIDEDIDQRLGKAISRIHSKPIIIRWIRTGSHPFEKKTICLSSYYIQFSTN